MCDSTVPPAHGEDLTLTVSIGGQPSVMPRVHFRRPEIDALAWPADGSYSTSESVWVDATQYYLLPRLAQTQGGTKFAVVGRNFPPVVHPPVSVTVILGSIPASRCRVVTSSAEKGVIECRCVHGEKTVGILDLCFVGTPPLSVPEGAGTHLAVSATVGTQPSVSQDKVSFNYAPPSIASVSPDALTTGGTTHIVYGYVGL
jgi:hypothetical protein